MLRLIPRDQGVPHGTPAIVRTPIRRQLAQRERKNSTGAVSSTSSAMFAGIVGNGCALERIERGLIKVIGA